MGVAGCRERGHAPAMELVWLWELDETQCIEDPYRAAGVVTCPAIRLKLSSL